MSIERIEAYQLREAPYDQLSFSNFLIELWTYLALKNEKPLSKIIINATFHRARLVRNAMDLLRINVMFNTPYQSPLNAEYAFSIIKRRLHKLNPQTK